VSYTGDNANVNYGVVCSIFQKLSILKGGLIKSNCLCHVIHNAAIFCLKLLPCDIENFVLKIHHEVLVSAKRVETLKACFEFFESKYRTVVLKHVQTRWTTLAKALDRIILEWEPLKQYFLDLGEEDCPPAIWSFIGDQQDGFSEYLTIPECYIHLVSHVLNLLSKYIKKFEENDFCAIDLHVEMTCLRDDLQSRLEKKFCGIVVSNALKNHERNIVKKFEKEVVKIYTQAL